MSRLIVNRYDVYTFFFPAAYLLSGPGGSHRPFVQGSVAGTPDFLSLTCHAGGTHGRRDDIEALGYVLLYLLRGRASPLPWSCARSDAEGHKLKRDADLAELCAVAPGMQQWVELARATPYEAAPDYAAFSAILQQLQPGTDTAAAAGSSKKTSSKAAAAAAGGSSASGSAGKGRKRAAVSDAVSDGANSGTARKKKLTIAAVTATDTTVDDTDEDDGDTANGVAEEPVPPAKKARITTEATSCSSSSCSNTSGSSNSSSAVSCAQEE
jgi:hypothetical protein